MLKPVMKIVIAIDSYKGCLSSIKAAEAARTGIMKIHPEADIVILPIADGGEGTAEVLEGYGVSAGVVEIAKGAGLRKVKDRNVYTQSTYPVGEMIKEEIKKGNKNIVITLGGSGTNDMGLGALQGLGLKVYDDCGNEMGPIAAGMLKHIAGFDSTELHKNIKGIRFSYLFDAEIPFCGPEGAVMLYAPQKGMVNLNDLKETDAEMQRVGHLIAKHTHRNPAEARGAGAAGGCGGGFYAFLHAEGKPGIEEVLRAARFDQSVSNADLVITGEGKSDRQTCQGKAAAGILKEAHRYNVPVLLVSGRFEDIGDLQRYGFDYMLCINSGYDKDPADPLNPEVAAKRIANKVSEFIGRYKI